MAATNCRVVLLSGTPMINYPNEIAILFNILRGYIKTWSIKLTIDSQAKVDEDKIKNLLKFSHVSDYVKYNPSNQTLQVTRNPFGFVNTYQQGTEEYNGVVLHKDGEITDDKFIDMIKAIFKRSQITFTKRDVKLTLHKLLPDDSEEFIERFIDMNKKTLNNPEMFMRRIIGLTSYFRSAQEELMPSFDKTTDLVEVLCEMSDEQFLAYSKARVEEHKQESSKARAAKKKNDLFDEVSSTYRIFSRLFCNFVFPSEIPRPLPQGDKDIANNVKNKIEREREIDLVSGSEVVESDSGMVADDTEIIDETNKKFVDASYETRINEALMEIERQQDRFLSDDGLALLSPKFLEIKNRVMDEANQGKHLIYSQFRTLEGIGLLKLVLEKHGYKQFKLIKNGDGEWILDMPDDTKQYSMFALYTGTETAEEKEILRNVFNDDWKLIPETLRQQLETLDGTNIFGSIIKGFYDYCFWC